MPRKPVPCRGCGKSCNLGSKSARPDPLCHDCRRKARMERQEVCRGGCGKTADYHYRSARDREKPWTCLDCVRKRPGYKGAWRPAQPFPVTCVICGRTVETVQPDQKTCLGTDCRRKFKRIKANERSRRYLRSHPTQPRGSCRIWVVNCVECANLFVARSARAKLCGAECRRKHNNRMTCENIMRRYREDPEFRDLVISKAQNRRADRLGLEGITSPATLIAYLMERDHGRCGKCHKPIRAKKGSRRPSIGHIIPLARGGQHELTNLQAEHLDCNLSAGDRGGGEQLLLVG